MKRIALITVLALCVSMLFSCSVSPLIAGKNGPLKDFIADVKDNKNYSMVITEERIEIYYLGMFKIVRTINIKIDGNVKYIADTETNSIKYIEYAQDSTCNHNRRFIYTKEARGWKKTIEENEESFEDALDQHYINNLLVFDNFKKKDGLYVSDVDVFYHDDYKTCNVIIDTEKKEMTAEMIGENEYGLELKRTIRISNIGTTTLDKPYKP